jgi:hypothetical protein
VMLQRPSRSRAISGACRPIGFFLSMRFQRNTGYAGTSRQPLQLELLQHCPPSFPRSRPGIG